MAIRRYLHAAGSAIAALVLAIEPAAGGADPALTLPSEALTAPHERLVVRGATPGEAELLFSTALAAVYFAGTGEVRLLALADPPPEVGNATSPSHPLAAAAARIAEGAERTGRVTLPDFLADVQSALAGDEGSLGPYLLMQPVSLAVPAGVRAASAASQPSAGAQSVVLSEGFEGDPWARWQRTDNTSGSYGWGTTTCDKHSGAQAADGVRGGTTGAALACAASYPNSVQNLIVDTQCEAFQGAGQAWLEGYGTVGSEQGYDQLAIVFNQSGSTFQGNAFSGTYSGWWHVIFNLRQFSLIGDLTQRACNTLAFAFSSDSTIATSFGARIDDITITTEAAPAVACSVSAAPSSGAAPLDVSLSSAVSGASGSAQYDWDFGDGTSSTSASPTHRFLVRGTYNPLFQVTDGTTVCTATAAVTVSASGITPSPGVFEGTTSQGKKLAFTVAADGHISPYTYGYACSNTTGESTVTTTGCTYSDGGFNCGSTSCQSYVTNARIRGTFDSPTTAVGFLSVTTGSNPAIGSSCCYLSNVTWSAARTGEVACTVSCFATVPTSGQAGTPVAFQASATPANCTGAPSYSWSFGDGASSAQEDPAHTYAAAGSYSWTLTVAADGQTCTRTGTITISGGPACTLSCNATVPATAAAGAAVPFQGSATPANCTGAPSYFWTFGDGATSTEQSPSHAYAAAGSYGWTLNVAADAQTCAKAGTVAVSAVVGPTVYLVPSVAHLPGAGGTQWRTDVAVVGNPSATAHLTLTYTSDSQTLGTGVDLAPNATVEWRDILVSRFGMGSGVSSSGVLNVSSDVPVVIVSRTYNQTATGTFGQYYPACTVGDGLGYGQTGTLAQLKKNGSFRTNVGILNLGTSSCSVTVKLFRSDGVQVGGSKTMTAAGGRWVQQYDIFANVGAGSNDIAYATVAVQTPGGKVWAYASVVDIATGDPTTIPVLVP
jgi:PKD repeat protein